jgi:hypothetical protein
MSAMSVGDARQNALGQLKQNIRSACFLGKAAKCLGSLSVSPVCGSDKEKLMKVLSAWEDIIMRETHQGAGSSQLGTCRSIVRGLRTQLSCSFTNNQTIEGVVQIALSFPGRAYGKVLSGPDRPLYSSLTVQLLCVSPEGMVNPAKKISGAGLMMMIKAAEIALFYNISSIKLSPTSHSKVIQTYKNWGFVPDKQEDEDLILLKNQFRPLLQKLRENVARVSQPP